jgi:hypothetical protein
MPDPGIPDEDIIRITRAYLSRRRGQPAPRDLEANAMNFALDTRRRKGASLLLGVGALVVVSAVTAVGVLAFHRSERPTVGEPASASTSQLRIVRVPGMLVLPPLDRTISDSKTIDRLATDIRALPLVPLDERCPASFGTIYSLTFAPAGMPRWTATIQAFGCEVVEIGDGPLHWAANSPRLWSELGVALGLSADQLQPPVCLGPSTEPHCAHIKSSEAP